MAVLDKLFIRGVRSFGPDDEEKVKFSTPLTLFLGQNGCGKTTIIECLKYALTGETPVGTGNGGGFINDPKLSNKNTTRASVKVRFKDPKGDFITVAKFMEVTAKSLGKLSFKSLNPSVRWEDGTGARDPEDIGGRCADITAYCAQKLNVSKAIINNVIFCHQENSAWPLDEAKKLKEKFDEIFGATEYNRCVDRLRKEVKDKRTEIKLIKEQLALKGEIKKHADALKDKLTMQEAQMESIDSKITEKNKELDPMEKRIREIIQLEEVLGNLQNKLTGLEKLLEGDRQHQESIKKNLVEEYPGTDDQLEGEISNFNTKKQNIEADIKSDEAKKTQCEKKAVEFGKELQTLQIKLGQLKEEENQYQKRCKERDEMIEKAKVKFEVIDDESQGLSITEMLEKLKNCIKRTEQGFKELQKSKEEEESQLQQAIDAVRDKYAGSKESLHSKQRVIQELTNTIASLKVKLSQLGSYDSQLKIIEDRIKTRQDKFTKLKADFDEHQQIHEIDKLKEEIQTKEQALNKLEREHRMLQQNFLTEQKIDHEKSLIAKYEGEIDTLKRKNEQNFRRLFDEEPANYEEAVKTIQNREDIKCKNMTKAISDCEKKTSTLEATIKHTKKTLQNYDQELQINQNKMNSLCKGKDFTKTLQESYNRKEKLQKDKGTYRSAKVMYEAFINQFEQEKPCCPVCDTDFSAKRESVGAIVRKLKSNIQEIPNKLATTEDLLKKEEELYNKLQRLQPVSSTISSLKDEKIPQLQQQLHEDTERLEETNMELVLFKSQLEEPQQLLDTCRKVVSDATLLDRLAIDLAKSQMLVESLKEDLIRVPSNRTLEDAESELAKLKADISNLRKNCDNKKDVFDSIKGRIQAMNSDLQSEIQKKLEAQRQLQERPLLQKRLEESTDQEKKLKEEVVSLKTVVQSLEGDLNIAGKNRATAVQKNKRLLEERRVEIEAQKRTVQDIQKLHAGAVEYESSETGLKLETVANGIADVKDKIGKVEDARDVLAKTVADKVQQLANQDIQIRALRDNRELRQSRKKSSKTESEIQDLRKQIGNHNYSSVYEEKKRTEKLMEAKKSDIDKMLGEQTEIKKNIEICKRELNKPENKMALKEYMKKYYEQRVMEVGVNDLEAYTKVLEKSILLFHKERMVHINNQIRELWRTIYKGNDIDYIEIKTEDTIGSGTRRRSYEYKVVEVKKGVELDMKGRCSAGQRVLACLVIRMALAETFSSNCGILALDEPTTNLDRDNILSLSDALSKIITAREGQKNFQLLIITHDEDFLQTLTRDQSVSHYYKVTRDGEGFSKISRQIL